MYSEEKNSFKIPNKVHSFIKKGEIDEFFAGLWKVCVSQVYYCITFDMNFFDTECKVLECIIFFVLFVFFVSFFLVLFTHQPPASWTSWTAYSSSIFVFFFFYTIILHNIHTTVHNRYCRLPVLIVVGLLTVHTLIYTYCTVQRWSKSVFSLKFEKLSGWN